MDRGGQFFQELSERPHHVRVWIDDDELLFDQRIAPPKKWNEVHYVVAADLSTPRGLPLSVIVSGKHGVCVWSAEARMLEIADNSLEIWVRFRLPTDELLTIDVGIPREL